LQPGDVVLVKGSRGVHLERAIEAVRARKSEES
jgi:UDP-N-acetylmuramyl pentapeptide synthase